MHSSAALNPKTPDIKANKIKPICEMVEYANIRLILVCIIAAKLPSRSEATAKIANICIQPLWPSAPAWLPKAIPKIRKENTTAAIFGMVPTKVAVEVGAPS